MPEVLPGNGLQSSLASPITSGATTLTIQSADAAKWPASGQYRAVLCTDPINGPWEIVLVTGGQGTATLTITRAAEPYNGVQVAQAWSSGAGIAAVLTHDGLGGNFLQLTGGTLNGSLLFSPDNTYDLGASGATRPRDLWLARNANVGGNVGIGVAASTSSALTVVPNATLVGTTQYGVTAWPIFSSAATVMGAAVAAQSGTANVAFTQAESTDFLALGPNFGAASTITNAIGFHANNQGGARVTNAYGLYIDAQSGAGTSNIGLYNAGTTNLVGGLVGNLIFSPDNTFDIGAAAATRPRNVYAGTAFIGPSGTVSAPSYSFTVDGSIGMYAVGSAGAADVAWSCSRYLVLGSKIGTNFAANLYWDGSWHFYDTAQAGYMVTTDPTIGIRLIFCPIGSGPSFTVLSQLTSTGFVLSVPLLFGTDNTYDIGASGATRPRDLWLGRNLSVVGTSQLTDIVGIGAAPQSFAGLSIKDPGSRVGAGQYGLLAQPTFAAVATTAGESVSAFFSTAAATFTMATGFFFHANAPTIGVGSTVTSLYGLRVDNMGASGVTNAYGLYIAAQSGAATTNLGLYNLGTTRLDDVVGFAAAPTSTTGLLLGNTGLTGTSPFGVRLLPVFGSTATGNPKVIEAGFSTAAAAFTATTGAAINLAAPVIGAGSAVTTMRGLLVANQGNAAIANAYGIVITAQSGATTTNIGLWNQGTTQLDGVVGIGSASAANAGLTIQPSSMNATISYGVNLQPTFGTAVTASGYCLFLALGVSGAFTLTSGYGIGINAPSIGGSTITTLYGIRVFNQGGASVTNAYGVHIAAQSGSATTNIGLFNQGTTQLVSNVGIGLAPATNFGVQIGGAITSGSVNQFGVSCYPTFSSGATSQARALDAQVITAAVAFTMAAGYAVFANPPSLGAGSAITNAYGVFASNQGAAGVTNAYGVYIAAQSGAATNNIGLVNLGTSQLQGGVLVGGGQPPPASGLIIMGATPATTNTGMVGLGHTFQNPGGGASATLGTIGGSGPTAAAMNQWWQITVDGSTRFVPIWA